MPYIKEDRRYQLGNDGWECSTPGELNYLLTKLCTQYINNKKLSYQTINDIIGALEGAKLEFYRRVAVPYENAKMAENGDVY